MKNSSLILFFIIFLGLLFRFYQIFELVPFFGDQGWFYLSARDALLSGKLPLLGITTSITWLHQGALFTYLLMPGLVFFGFNPYSGVFLMALLSVINIILVFYLGTLIFSRRVGLISAFIMAISPLVVIHSRVSYHTTPIPLFMTLTALLLIKKRSFLSGLFLSFLYSLHLLTFLFWLPILIYVFRHRLSLSKFFVGFILGLIPFLLAGPVATGGIFIWLIFKLFTGFPTSNSLSFYLDQFSKFTSPDLLSLLGQIHPGSGSDAYFVLMYIPLALALGWLLVRLPKKILLPLLVIIPILNGVYLVRTRYLLATPSYNFSLSERIDVSQQIIAVSETTIPNISVVGPGSEFTSAVDTYKYLVWWLGQKHPPTGKNYKFVIDESNLHMSVIE